VSGRGSVFLLDEVDAALDEANQQNVGLLLKRLDAAYNRHCQILCVTHNSSFISLCDKIIQVNRRFGGDPVSPKRTLCFPDVFACTTPVCLGHRVGWFRASGQS
jgi:ABC-type Mn2+/Zn2+ transport system ATPase subunit